MESIKERVGAYLMREGETLSSLAEDLGMSRTTLRHKLDGRVEFKLSEADRLAKVLGCTVDELRESPHGQ